MSGTVIYGIKNCDTMKKALRWLDEQGVEYVFHDYKKAGVDEAVLKLALAQHGWEKVINQRGTTWRQLSEDVKAAMDDAGAVRIAQENASIVKRPLLLRGDTVYLGFKNEIYHQIFLGDSL